jgi:hypothetical protein
LLNAADSDVVIAALAGWPALEAEGLDAQRLDGGEELPAFPLGDVLVRRQPVWRIIEDAKGIRRVLVETNPDAFAPELARSLSNLSNSRRTALAMSTSTGMSSRTRARINITRREGTGTGNDCRE